jgi:SAM-dependent methyltransferase
MPHPLEHTATAGSFGEAVARNRLLATCAARPCPLCGGRSTRVISRRMQHRLDLITVLCNGCGFVFTNPMPDQAVYESFYEYSYAEFCGSKALGVTAKEEPDEIARLLDRLEALQPLRDSWILEVGPGRGQFLWCARQRGAEVLGIEPSKPFAAVLRQAALPAITQKLSDAHLDGMAFDVVILRHVLEHFYDPNSALEQARRPLREHGLLLVEGPNILKPFRSLDRYFLRYVHPSNFSPRTLVAFLSKHGFETLFIDDGGEDWRCPQDLLVIARKVVGKPVPVRSAQHPREVLEMLERYRRNWFWPGAARWRVWHLMVLARRLLIRLARKLRGGVLGLCAGISRTRRITGIF